TKLMELDSRREFTPKECELVAGQPYDAESQDDYYEDLMKMEDKEFRFWTSIDEVPNNLDGNWGELKTDYFERIRVKKERGVEREKIKIKELFQELEIDDLNAIGKYGELPLPILTIADIFADEEGNQWWKSNKWETNLCPFEDVWEFEVIAKERDDYYLHNSLYENKDRYSKWVDYMTVKDFKDGDLEKAETIQEEPESLK
ncbi:unnamed protein product, partial [marine sediment metagenome]